MLDRAKLVNIALFMERVPVTGKEALAWAETYRSVSDEVAALDALKAEAPKMVAP